MRRFVLASWFAGLTSAGMLAHPAVPVFGQTSDCIPGDPSVVEIQLGSPDAQGTTLQDKMGSPGEKHGYFFKVARPSAAFVYVGDQWYDLDLYLYSRGRCGPTGFEELARSWSVRAERRTIQFVRPDEQIINLVPGDYTLIVGHKYAEDPQFARDFDPSKGFTVRVATQPPVCPGALDPQDEQVPNPTNPAVMMTRRPDSALYQLAMIVDPPAPGPFSLLSFNAVVSPPYTDLYDFSWTIDGKPVPDNATPTVMSPASALGAPGSEHTVAVQAKGARVYPDPDQPSIPPNLAVQCTFKLGTS